MANRIRPMTKRRAYTLLEVVLAVALTTALLAIIATAIDLFLFRVDAGRTEVETAQLARALLKQMADDIQAVRFSLPAGGTATSGSSSSGSSTGSSADSTSESSATSEEIGASSSESSEEDQSETTDSGFTLGISGTETELWIDRAAQWRWQRLSEAEVLVSDEPAYGQRASLPQTVHYFVRDGRQIDTDAFIAAGLEERPADDVAGLCREHLPIVAAHLLDDDLLASMADSESLDAQLELLAPEVVDLRFAYYDGTEMLDEWDMAEQQCLPGAVEIRLTLLKQSYALALGAEPAEQPSTRKADGSRQISESDVIEYRLVVDLPELQPPRQFESSRSTGSRGRSGSSSSSSPANTTMQP